MARSCIRCGLKLEEGVTVCPVCGTDITADSELLRAIRARRRATSRRRGLLIALSLLLAVSVLGAMAIGVDPQLLSPAEDPRPPILRPDGASSALDPDPTPEQKWDDHLYLNLRNTGSCEKLVGQVEITFVFVHEPQYPWTAKEKDEAQERLEAEIAALLTEAARFDVELTINATFGELYLSAAADHEDSYSWQTLYAVEQGYESLAEMQKAIDDRSNVASAPMVFLCNYVGRSYANPGAISLAVESMVLYYTEDFRHELFHLYGAEDYYFPALVEEAASLYLPESIMNDGNVTDDLTAYAIGWRDVLSDNAVAFLETTSTLTRVELENATEEEQFTGTGTRVYDNGDRYTGDLVFGVPHGKGTYTFSDGSVYTGEFEGGLFHGYGVFTDVTYGFRYEGGFSNDLFHGEGKLIFDDGEYYVGGFRNDQFHGKGTYAFANGDVYTGEFKDGLFHGQGTYTYADGTVERGTWSEDEFLG